MFAERVHIAALHSYLPRQVWVSPDNRLGPIFLGTSKTDCKLITAPMGQMLRKSTAPLAPQRVCLELSEKKSPGRPTSSSRPTGCQVRAKVRSCFRAWTWGSVSQRAGSVRTRARLGSNDGRERFMGSCPRGIGLPERAHVLLLGHYIAVVRRLGQG